MTQPDRPDRAAGELTNEERVAAQLRLAARSYEPDGDRIRRLMDARAGARSGLPVASRARPAQPRGIPGRAVLWPVLGSAAAAAVILAVAAAGAEPGGENPASGDGTVTVAPASGSPAAPTLASPISTSVSGSPVSSGAVSGSSGAGGSTPPSPSHPGVGSATGAAAIGGAQASSSAPPVPGAGPVVSSTSAALGGRRIGVELRSATPDQEVSLGAAGEAWLVTSAVVDQPHTNGSSLLGPAQLQGQGGRADPGPFRVSWQNGTPSDTGSATTWLTAPSGANTSVTLQVRYKTDPSTIVLYIGTVGGSGRLSVTVPGNGSTGIDLPACATTCGQLATITVQRASTDTGTSGDLSITLTARDQGSRVGLAAASLH